MYKKQITSMHTCMYAYIHIHIHIYIYIYISVRRSSIPSSSSSSVRPSVVRLVVAVILCLSLSSVRPSSVPSSSSAIPLSVRPSIVRSLVVVLLFCPSCRRISVPSIESLPHCGLPLALLLLLLRWGSSYQHDGTAPATTDIQHSGSLIWGPTKWGPRMFLFV